MDSTFPPFEAGIRNQWISSKETPKKRHSRLIVFLLPTAALKEGSNQLPKLNKYKFSLNSKVVFSVMYRTD